MNKNTPGNFGFGDMPADYRMRYKKMIEMDRREKEQKKQKKLIEKQRKAAEKKAKEAARRQEKENRRQQIADKLYGGK
jgi:hypothetical protein